MPLELTVLRCPDAVPPEARTVAGGEFSVGRGPGVDWVLPDPERLLSKRHFALAFRGGAWQLADTSTNGTFINTDDTALGAGEVRTLRNGDRIRLGAYEIEVRLTDDAHQFGGYGAASGGRAGGGRAGSGDPFGDPFGMDPLAPPPPAHRPFGETAPQRDEIPPILPDDFDLLGSDPIGRPIPGAFHTPVQSDHSSVMEDAFQPPRAEGQVPMHTGGIIPNDSLLPDDWDKDLLDGIGAPAAASPAPVGRSAPPPPAPPSLMPSPQPAPAVRPVMAPSPAARRGNDASPFDEPDDLIHGAQRLGPPIQAPAPRPPPAAPLGHSIFDEPDDAQQPAVQPVVQPVARPVARPVAQPVMRPVPPAVAPQPDSIFNEPDFNEPGFNEPGFNEPDFNEPGDALMPPPVQPAAQPVAQPRPRAAAPAAAPPRAADEAALLAAFLEGAEMAGTQPADPEATMRALGAAFRAMVAGLRGVLIARASIKSEFRIEQTMIRARGNNPLKFSAGDDDALSALLGTGRRVDMAPAAAVSDALTDIRLHELASMAAMQSAVRALMEGMDPAKLRAAAEQAGGMTVLPAQRKARAWDSFESLYSKTIQALSDDFDSVFGKAFARAYERAMDEVSAKERR